MMTTETGEVQWIRTMSGQMLFWVGNTMLTVDEFLFWIGQKASLETEEQPPCQ